MDWWRLFGIKSMPWRHTRLKTLVTFMCKLRTRAWFSIDHMFNFFSQFLLWMSESNSNEYVLSHSIIEQFALLPVRMKGTTAIENFQVKFCLINWLIKVFKKLILKLKYCLIFITEFIILSSWIIIRNVSNKKVIKIRRQIQTFLTLTSGTPADNKGNRKTTNSGVDLWWIFSFG